MKASSAVKDRSIGVPQYLAIAETIRSWIRSGRYKSGDSIATIDELAREFDVAKGTIQEALRDLSESGIIITSRGRRSRVGRQPEIRPVFGTIESKDSLLIERVGESPNRLLSSKVMKPSKSMAKMFEFKPSQMVAEYTVLLYLNGAPNGYGLIYLAAGRRSAPSPIMEHSEVKADLRERMDRADRSERHIAATTADIELAHLLEIPVGSPILKYSCAMWDEKEEFLLYFIDYLRSDGCEYRLDA